jgi:hypothetical protein
MLGDTVIIVIFHDLIKRNKTFTMIMPALQSINSSLDGQMLLSCNTMLVHEFHRLQEVFITRHHVCPSLGMDLEEHHFERIESLFSFTPLTPGERNTSIIFGWWEKSLLVLLSSPPLVANGR